jgi:transposase
MRTVSSVSSSEEEVTIKYVCGIDGWRANPVRAASVGQRSVWWSSQATSLISKRDGRCGKRNWRELDATPNQIIIGMEATSRYHENLYHELEQKGYQMRLLHPGQTHHFHQQQGRLTKTDRLDAMTIARALRESGKNAWAIFEAEQIATYRELVRLHTQSLVRRLPAIRTRSRRLQVVLFASRLLRSL